MMKNSRRQKPKEPIQCFACKRLFLPHNFIVNHHVSYYPEKTVQVHYKCHSIIHRGKINPFKWLQPDWRQMLRYYKKKTNRESPYWTWEPRIIFVSFHFKEFFHEYVYPFDFEPPKRTGVFDPYWDIFSRWRDYFEE